MVTKTDQPLRTRFVGEQKFGIKTKPIHPAGMAGKMMGKSRRESPTDTLNPSMEMVCSWKLHIHIQIYSHKT